MRRRERERERDTHTHTLTHFLGSEFFWTTSLVQHVYRCLQVLCNSCAFCYTTYNLEFWGFEKKFSELVDFEERTGKEPFGFNEGYIMGCLSLF